MPTARPWARVAAAVRSRRIELGRTQQEMAEIAGVSLATWRLIETEGRDRYQDLTLRGVTRSLGWRSDAVARLVAGEVDDGELLDPDTGGPSGAVDVPAGLAGRWHELTAVERAKVEAFIDGLVAGRS